jgi:hypothetical protein
VRLDRAILATAYQAGVRRHRMAGVAQPITIGYVATVRLANAAVCMGGVAALSIIAHRAIATVVIATRRLEGRVRMVPAARISQATRFALEHNLESVAATSKWDLF